MGGYEELIAGIKAVVRRNGRREITGDALQQVLVGMVSAIGANSAFAGVATPDTDPGRPDANVFWIAATPGTYAHFGNAAVTASAILSNETGEWVATPLNFGEPYRPFPEFHIGYNTRRGSYKEVDAITSTGTYKTVVYYQGLQIGVISDSKDFPAGFNLQIYQYVGHRKNNSAHPWHFVGSLLLDDGLPYKYGVNYLPAFDYLDLFDILGLKGNVHDDLFHTLSEDITLHLRNEGDSNSYILTNFAARDPQHKIRIFNGDVFAKATGPDYFRGWKKRTPLITQRFGACLADGAGNKGPLKVFRVGIYLVNPPKGESGLGAIDGDVYVKIGVIQEIGKAYNNVAF